MFAARLRQMGTALFLLPAAVAVGSFVDTFTDVSAWKPHSDSGCPPVFKAQPDREGMLVTYTQKPPGWGNLVRDIRLAGAETAILLELTVLTALRGGSFGQLVTGLRVVRVDRTPLSLLPALLRSALICLVVPPLVFTADQRGLHDLAAGTVVVRR